MISTSLEKKAYKGKQANNFGMKRLIKKTNINKGQEVLSINLNLQTKAAQYLVQQGQTKEGGGGASSKNKYRFFLILFYKCKRKTTYKKKYADNKNKTKGTLLYNHQIKSRMH